MIAMKKRGRDDPPAFGVAPLSLLWLSGGALGLAVVVCWCAGLEAKRCWQLVSGLEGTACLASGFGPHWELEKYAIIENPTRLGRLWWWMTNASRFNATAYYPLPFYFGLGLLAISTVLGAL